MKKNVMMRLAAFLLVAVLISTSAISGTYAKYVSTASGSDVARVAKWDITVEGEQLGVENKEITFNLFDTIQDTLGGTETDVDDAETIIAPGTTGAFALNVLNESEVNAEYTIVMTEVNLYNVPLQYSLDGATWTDDFTAINAAIVKQAIAMGNGEAEHIIYWRWAFEGTDPGAPEGQNNASDTLLGVAAMDTALEVTITATVIVEQVN